jgi:hypothetical protein
MSQKLACGDAVGSVSNIICLNGSRSIAKAVIRSQVASQETGIVNVHNADMAMY